MPLLEGKEHIGDNIREMRDHPGPRMKKLAKKYGPQKMKQIRKAAALRKAYGSKRKSKRGRKRG